MQLRSVQLSVDSDAGRRFAGLLESSSRPLNQQTLQALLSDIVGADVGLASAFRLLLNHAVYVEFFSATSINAAQCHSLTSIAVDSLAPQLAERIADFLEGYRAARFPAAAPGLPAAASAAQFTQDSHPPTEVDFGPAGHGSAAGDCPPTEYERPAAADAPPSPAATGQATGQSAPQSTRVQPAGGTTDGSLPFRAIAIVLAMVAGVALLFRVPALCEPIGLCSAPSSRGDEPGSEPPAAGTVTGQKSAPTDSAPSSSSTFSAPPSVPPSASAGASPSRGSAEPASDLVRPPLERTAQRPSPSLPRSQPTAPPSAPAPSAGPPLRDEPLW